MGKGNGMGTVGGVGLKVKREMNKTNKDLAQTNEYNMLRALFS